ncbi:MAG: 5'-nucleotidase C-terminal domain-containing protein [Roseibium sp.]|nr:5'-nucleotidase C-terminal domain-containing protein [Roseibium sp.]
MRLAALITAAALTAGSALAQDRLTIVHVNDLDRMEGYGDTGGVARLATVIADVRADGGTVLATSAGDSISPSLLSSFDEGAHMIALLNMVGLDAMALGNHEFDFGPDVLRTRISEANFTMLSNNAFEPDGTLVDGVTENMMVSVGDHMVGIFGLTTDGTAVKSSPGDVTFGDPVDVAASTAAALRDAGADVVIALAHTDRPEDNQLVDAGDVDILLSGDDHDLVIRYDGNVAMVESGSQASLVTVVTLDIETVEGRRGPRVEWSPAFEVINTAGVEPDAAVAAEVAKYEAFLSAELDIEIGATPVLLDTRRTTVRAGESAFGNLTVDAMRAETGADVAITNGGGIRGDTTYEPGTMITRRDVLTELPFGNKTVLLEVTGADILAALENGVSAIEDGGGRFPHVSGITFSFNPALAAGERVSEVMVAGAPLDESATYLLATNDFMGNGGDGYAVFAGKPSIIEENAAELMAAQVIRAFETGAAVPMLDGRVTEIR